MIGIGCLLPFVLMIAGAAIGGVIGGTPDDIWGAVAGAAIGLVAMVVMLRVLERTRGNLPE